MKVPKNIAVIFIGLDKYSLFYNRFYKSVQENFLPSIDKHYFIFSDSELLVENGDETFTKTKSYPTPRDIKLHKFHFIKSAWDKIKRYEYVVYFDADNLVRQKIEAEDFFNHDELLVGVLHPWGSIRNSKDKFESDSKSAAFLEKEKIDIPYHQSCFWSGWTERVESMVNECYRTLEHDIKIKHENKNNICDEVHVNRYFALNKKDLRSLGREYANPGEAYQSERRDSKKPFGDNIIISHDNTNQTYKHSLEFLERQGKMKDNISFAGWAQVKDNTKATFEMLKKFKFVNPNTPVHLTVTGDKNYSDIAKSFGCSIDVEEEESIQSWAAGNRLVKHDIWKLFQSLKKVCETFLKDKEWIVLLEDDVEAFTPPREEPEYSFNGPNGPSFTEELLSEISEKFPHRKFSRRYTGCGGSLLKREDFLSALKKMTSEMWEKYTKFDDRLNHYADISISFLLMHGGFEIGPWKEFTGWTNPHKKSFAFAHGNKEFYGKEMTAKDLENMDYIKYSGIYINSFVGSTESEFRPRGRITSVQHHSFFEYLVDPNGVCLDVGCRDFVFSGHVKNICSKIIAFDPAQDVRDIKDPKILFMNCALTTSNCDRAFLVKDGRNSSHSISFENISSHCVGVPNIHIENLTRILQIKEFELIKLDCEGSEYALMNWLADHPIAKQISVQFHDWNGKNPYEKTERYYDKLFNKLRKTYYVAKHQKSHKDKEVYNYDDSVFVRK